MFCHETKIDHRSRAERCACNVCGRPTQIQPCNVENIDVAAQTLELKAPDSVV
jgi:hypothetical protein